VAADEYVQKVKDAPWRQLKYAYRDPDAAHARLNDLIQAEGWEGAARRLEAEPAVLGRLRGGKGLFASRSAEHDRAYAISTARSVARGLTYVVEAAQRAERDYRKSVTAQIERDAVGVPKLSAEAAALLEAVRAAAGREPPGENWREAERRSAAVAEVWKEGRRNPALAAEIGRFEQAAEQRLGYDGMAAALRSAREGVAPSVPGMGPEHADALRQLGRAVAAARRGSAAYTAQRSLEAFREREAERERLGHRRGPSLGL
jgi:hypothetical protein